MTFANIEKTAKEAKGKKEKRKKQRNAGDSLCPVSVHGFPPVLSVDQHSFCQRTETGSKTVNDFKYPVVVFTVAEKTVKISGITIGDIEPIVLRPQ